MNNTTKILIGIAVVGAGIGLYYYSRRKSDKSDKKENFSNATAIKYVKMDSGECPSGCLMQRRQQRCLCQNN